MHDGYVLPHPPVLRALGVLRTALEKTGHHVIDWHPFRHKELYEVQVRHEKLLSTLSEPPPKAQIETADFAEDALTECRPAGEPHITSIDPEDIEAALNSVPGQELPQKPSPFHTRRLTAYELWKVHERKRQLRKDYLDHWMNSAKTTGTKRPIDALISPVAPFAAPPHGKNRHARVHVPLAVLIFR